MRMIILPLILSATVALAQDDKGGENTSPNIQPKKGETVYFPNDVSWVVGSLRLTYLNIPYSRLNCQGTRECRYEVKACEPFELGKQTEAKTSVWKDGMRWLLEGDWRKATFLSQNQCRDAHLKVLADMYTPRPRLGVEVEPITPDIATRLRVKASKGLAVRKLYSGMPAEDAGIRVNDVILRVGDVEMSTLEDLSSALQEKGGQDIRVRVLRGDSELTITVRVKEYIWYTKSDGTLVRIESTGTHAPDKIPEND